MQSDFVVFVLFFKPVRLFFPLTLFPQGVLLYTSVTLESWCATQWEAKRPSPPPAPLNLSKHLPHPPWQIL